MTRPEDKMGPKEFSLGKTTVTRSFSKMHPDIFGIFFSFPFATVVGSVRERVPVLE